MSSLRQCFIIMLKLNIFDHFIYRYKNFVQWNSSLVEWSVCLTANHKIAGSIPGTSTKEMFQWIRFGIGSTRSFEDIWVGT